MTQTPQAPKAWPRAADIISVLLIMLAVCLVYWPSLDHVILADQLDYLVDTFGRYGFWDTFAHTYSYSRTRVMAAGDTMLFRPGFLGVLAMMKAVSGSNLSAWQACGIALHCLMVYAAFRFFRYLCRRGQRWQEQLAPTPTAVKPHGGKKAAVLPAASPSKWDWWLAGLLPAVLTAFFSLNFAGMAMITWSHISPCIVFAIFVLLYGELLLRYVDEPTPGGWTGVAMIAGAWLLAALAAFTHELGQFFAVLAGMFLGFVLWRRGRLRRGLVLMAAFMLILVVYQTANHLDRAAHAGQFKDDLSAGSIQDKIFSTDTITNTGRYLAFSVVQPFFPTQANLHFQGRPFVEEPDFTRYAPGFWVLLGLAVLAVWLAVCARGLVRLVRQRAMLPLAALLLVLGLLALYDASVILGRMNMRPIPNILSCNSYYVYTSLLLFCVASCLLLVPGAQRPASGARAWRGLYAFLLGGMLLLAGCSGYVLLRTNRDYTVILKVFRAPMDLVYNFIQAHRHEPDFSFAYDMEKSDAVFWMRGLPLTSIYFRQYEDNRNPKYVLACRGGALANMTGSEWRAQNPGRLPPFFPDLVKAGTHFHIFQVNGQYVGIAYEESGYYPPLATGIYLADVEARTREAYEQLRAKQGRRE